VASIPVSGLIHAGSTGVRLLQVRGTQTVGLREQGHRLTQAYGASVVGESNALLPATSPESGTQVNRDWLRQGILRESRSVKKESLPVDNLSL